MKPTEPILEAFIDRIKPQRADIAQIFLFGSRARGDERPDSDYDLLLLVNKKDRQMISRLYDAVMECLLQFGRLISLKIFTVDQWRHLLSLKTPFSRAVLKEGRLLG